MGSFSSFLHSTMAAVDVVRAPSLSVLRQCGPPTCFHFVITHLNIGIFSVVKNAVLAGV